MLWLNLLNYAFAIVKCAKMVPNGQLSLIALAILNNTLVIGVAHIFRKLCARKAFDQ